MKDQDPHIPGLIPEQDSIPGLTAGSELRRSVHKSTSPRTSQIARENVGKGAQKNPRSVAYKLITKVMLLDVVIGVAVFGFLFSKLEDTGGSGLRIGEWTSLMWGVLGMAAVALWGAFYFHKQARQIDENTTY